MPSRNQDGERSMASSRGPRPGGKNKVRAGAGSESRGHAETVGAIWLDERGELRGAQRAIVGRNPKLGRLLGPEPNPSREGEKRQTAPEAKTVAGERIHHAERPGSRPGPRNAARVELDADQGANGQRRGDTRGHSRELGPGVRRAGARDQERRTGWRRCLGHKGAWPRLADPRRNDAG